MEEQNWRIIQLPNGSVGHGDGQTKKSKTGEDGRYHTSGWPWRQRKKEEQKKE